MDEALAYKWTNQALKPIEYGTSLEAYKYQQVADKVASAILEAYKLGLQHYDMAERDHLKYMHLELDRIESAI